MDSIPSKGSAAASRSNCGRAASRSTSSPPGIGIKPTLLSLADFAALPTEQRARYTDSATLGPAFVHLATADERGINGQRFSAHELARVMAGAGS